MPQAARSYLMVLVLGALIVPYFLNLDANSLWDTKESYVAETPREMLESGDLSAPMFNYRPRTVKPPLGYWVVALSYRLFGIGEFAVRLPAALAAAATVLLVWRIARLFFSPWAALAAAAMAATTPRFYIIARKDPVDAMLLFWLVASAGCLLRSERERSLGAWLLAWLCAGLGFLTKGPIALLIPGASWLAAHLWARGPRIRPGRVLLAAAAFAAAVAPWYLWTYGRHGTLYITGFFLQDNLGRYLSQSFGPARGPLYYAAVFAVDFFPWSLAAAAAAVDLWRRRRMIAQHRTFADAFLVIWPLFVFLFFSLSRNKQEYYILPMYPILSVWIAGAAERGMRAAESRAAKTWGWALMAASLSLLGLGIAVPLAWPSVMPVVTVSLLLPPVLVLLLGSIAPAIAAIRGRPLAGIFGLAVPTYLLVLLLSWIYLPALEAFHPVKALCAAIAAQAGPADEVGYYREAFPSMVFYLRRPIFEELDEESMVRRLQGPARVFCIMSERDYSYFVAQRDLILYILDRRERLVTQLRAMSDRRSAVGRELVVVSNRPPAEDVSAGGPAIP